MAFGDAVNGGFELLGAAFAWKNAATLYRHGEIRGVYWPAWVFFSAWGIWNLWYYPSLGQWLSFGAGCLLVAGNVAWCVLAATLVRKGRA